MTAYLMERSERKLFAGINPAVFWRDLNEELYSIEWLLCQYATQYFQGSEPLALPDILL